MAWEPISPELALIDPDLAARARAGLEEPAPALSPSRPAGAAAPAPAAGRSQHHPYPFWARVTAAVWLLALGIMVGGAAIPHAQDRPRVIPRNDDITVCIPPKSPGKTRPPGSGSGIAGRQPPPASSPGL